jgi:hypothetical protein
MSSDDDKSPVPPDERTVAGQPTQKLTLFEQLIKKAAQVLRQSR